MDTATTAIARAVQAYEPEATAVVIASPKRLLSVLLEASHRAVAAAEPHVRAAEREATLSPPGYDDRHPDGSIGPDAAPPYGGDAAYWYRRWLFLARQLDEEAVERMNAYANFNEKLAGAVRDAEREACARWLETRAKSGMAGPVAAYELEKCARLLREETL